MPASDVVTSTRYPQGPTGFVYDEIPYVSLAQHYYYQMALFAGDFQIADKILRTKDVDAVKIQAKRIRTAGTDKAWIGNCLKILVQGLKAKFLQELSLCDWLLNQDEVTIRSISSLWGLTRAEITRDWTDGNASESNPLGDALTEVRKHLLRK